MPVLDADLLSHDEIAALLERCSPRSFTGVRNATLIVLLWRTGIRISECLSLRPKDIDLNARTLTVQHGKGDKRRVIGLDPPTVSALRVWMRVREQRAADNGALPLFCTSRGGNIDSSYVRHLLPRLARQARLSKRVHAHGLRHRFAADLIDEGASITTVRDLLGHSSVAITDTYLRRLGVGEAIEFSRSRTWSFA